jgi:hypothetical protein
MDFSHATLSRVFMEPTQPSIQRVQGIYLLRNQLLLLASKIIMEVKKLKKVN